MKSSKFQLNQTVIIGALFLLALTLRVIFVFQWNDTPYGSIPLLDAKVYDDWAMTVAQGHLIKIRAFYSSPLYPYILGGLYAAFGHSLLLAGLFNALLSAATVGVLAALTCTLFGLEAGIVAGLLAAFYRPLIFYTAPVMKESLGLLLLTLFLLFALRALKQNRMRDYIWGGAMLGLCVLVRANALLLAPMLLALGFFKWRAAVTKNAIVFIAMTLLCIAPATLHNYLASDDFVLINYGDGFNLYIGHSPIANGTNQYPPEISTDPVQEELATMWEAREAAKHDVKPSEVSAYWRGRALDFMLHHPWRELVLLRNKFLAFWNSAEAFDSYDVGFIRKNFDTVLSWPLVPFWLIAVLAVFGAATAWRERRETVITIGGFAFIYMGSVLLFYVADRYRLPIVVFLLPLAGAALPYGRKLFQAKKPWRRLSGAVALSLIFLFFALRSPSDAVDLTAFDWGTLSTIYSDTGQQQETLDSMHKALAIPLGDPGSQAFVRGAMVEQARGHYEEAERILTTGIKYYPADGVLEYNYGRLKAMEGDLPAALKAFQKAIKLMPSYVLNYYAMAKVYEKLNDHAHAVEAVWHGLAVNPNDPLLKQALAELKKD